MTAAPERPQEPRPDATDVGASERPVKPRKPRKPRASGATQTGSDPARLPPKPKISAAAAAALPPRPRVRDEEDEEIAEDPRVDDPPALADTDEDSAPDSAPDSAVVEVIEQLLVESVDASASPPAVVVSGLTKSFGETTAVDGVDLSIPAGSFYGLVGPNGAGKTTTLSMIAGLIRPTSGSVRIGDVDALAHPQDAKRQLGILPDRLRTFDRLTGRQLLYYYGVLRGLAPAVAEIRTADLARAFDLSAALSRPVSDYSAGMTKKILLAGALIHSPRVLVLDEPFESVDPVSSAVILDILETYVAHGGTVLLSSHGMQLVERVCSRVAILVAGKVLAEGTVAEVRGEATLEERFLQLAGGLGDVEGLEWLHAFSD